MTAPPARLSVEGGRALRGRVRTPGDKSISHRALLVGAVCEGESRARGLSDGADVRATRAAVTRLGATVEGDRIRGGAARLHAPDGPIDAGNSGTTMRLLAGLVAGWPWEVVIEGDASLSRRPMDRVAEPLRRMGARVEGRGERALPPITVRGGHLHGVDYTPPVASAQVKSCVLLAGLRAEGETVVREPVLTRVHTEELLARCGAAVSEESGPDGHVVRLRPGELASFDLTVPGDPSQAAFWVVAATIVPGSDVVIEQVYAGPARRGFLDVLRRMGADIDERPVADGVDIAVRAARLHGAVVDGAEITGLDEVPVLAVAAAMAEGDTVFRAVGDLRVKESDRLAATAALARAFGAKAEIDGDDLVVTGSGRLVPASFDAAGDHRMAMAAAVAGLATPPGEGATVITGFDAVATSYPGFVDDLETLAAGARR